MMNSLFKHIVTHCVHKFASNFLFDELFKQYAK